MLLYFLPLSLVILRCFIHGAVFYPIELQILYFRQYCQSLYLKKNIFKLILNASVEIKYLFASFENQFNVDYLWWIWHSGIFALKNNHEGSALHPTLGLKVAGLAFFTWTINQHQIVLRGRFCKLTLWWWWGLRNKALTPHSICNTKQQEPQRRD